MSENLHDIDKLFRDAIERHEDMPSEKLWDAVDAGLDKSNVVHIKRKYNNLKRIAAVLVLLLLSVVGYEIFKTKTGTEGIAGRNDNKDGTKTAGAETAAPAKGSAVTAIKQENFPGQNNTVTANSGQSATVANAGVDSVSGAAVTVADKEKQPVPDLKNNSIADNNTSGSVNDKLTVPSNSGYKKQNSNLPAVNKKGDDGYNSRTAVNKSAKGKTKIKVKSPAPQQYGEEDNTEDDVNETGVKTAAVTNELSPIENSRVATLAERINKAMDTKELLAAGRQSPDVVIKKLKSSRSFRFNVMPFFAPQFTSTALKEEKKAPSQNSGPGGPPPPRPGGNNHKDQYKSEEQTQTSYTAGVLAEIPLGKKWSIQSGISYTQKNISIEPKKIYARPDKDGKVKYVFDCSSGYSYISTKTGTTPAVGDSISVTSSQNTLGYIGVPVAVNYKVSLGRFSIIPSFGTVFNFLTKQKIKTELVQGTVKEQRTIDKIEGLKSSYLNATAGVALEYDVNKRITLNIMPAGSFALTSINKDAGVKSYPNAFGVTGGVKIKF